MGVLVWRGSAYNDGNGCGGAAQTQRFPIHALELPAANGVRGVERSVIWYGGRGVRCIKFFPKNVKNVVYIRLILLLAGRDSDRGAHWQKITPPPIFFYFWPPLPPPLSQFISATTADFYLGSGIISRFQAKET